MCYTAFFKNELLYAHCVVACFLCLGTVCAPHAACDFAAQDPEF